MGRRMQSAQRPSTRDQLRAWRLLDLPFARTPATAGCLGEFFYHGPSQRQFFTWLEAKLVQGVEQAELIGAVGSGRSTLLRQVQATNGLNATPILAISHVEFAHAFSDTEPPVSQEIPIIVTVDCEDSHEARQVRERIPCLTVRENPSLVLTTRTDAGPIDSKTTGFPLQKLSVSQWEQCLRSAFRFAGREHLPMSAALVRWLVQLHDSRWSTLVPHLQNTLLACRPNAEGTLSFHDFIATNKRSDLHFTRAA